MKFKGMYCKAIKTYREMSLPVKASLWFIICNILQRGISVITVPLFTRLMSTEQYGLFSIYTSWEAIIVIFVTLRIPYVAYNNGLVKYDKDIPRLTSTFQGLTTTIVGVAYAIYLIFRDVLNHILGLNTLLVSLMFLQMLLQPAYELWTSRQRFEYQYRKMALMTMGIAVFNPVLGFIGVYLSENKAIARVIATVITQCIFCGTIYIINAIRGKKIFSKLYWQYALTVSIPLLPHYLSTTIMNQADRIMIQKMCGLTEAAIYGVSHSAAYLATLFTSAINNSIMPWTYQKLKSKEYDALYSKIHYIIIIVGILMTMVIALGPDIVSILATEEYKDAVWVIPPLSGGLFFCFIYQVYGNIEFYFEYKKPSLYIAVSATILNIILNFIFINIFGFIAAGYTTLVSYIFFAIAHYIVCMRIIKARIGNIEVYNNRAIICTGLVFLVILMLFTISYSNYIIRYFIVVTILICCLVKRNLIIDAIKEMRK